MDQRTRRLQRLRHLGVSFCTAVLTLCLLAVLIFTGVIWPNRVFASSFSVRGVDVSHYQGNLDWDHLAAAGIDFAYIKAAEGSSHIDTAFKTNFEQAGRAGLARGVYHFLSFDSPGSAQARRLIDAVPDPGELP